MTQLPRRHQIYQFVLENILSQNFIRWVLPHNFMHCVKKEHLIVQMWSWSSRSYFKKLFPALAQNIKVFLNRHGKFWGQFRRAFSLNQHICSLEFIVRITHSRKVTVSRRLYIIMVLIKSSILSKYVFNLNRNKTLTYGGKKNIVINEYKMVLDISYASVLYFKLLS